MIYTGLKFKLEPKDFTRVMKKTFDKLNNFPESVWTPVIRELEAHNRANATHITRFGQLSASTLSWRKSRAKTGKTVPTYTNSKARVLNSPRVGRRTGTFVNDYRNSKEPTVTLRTMTHTGEYTNPIKNGSLLMSINPEAFYHNYPYYFQKYLKRRGIIGPGGFNQMPPSVEIKIFDYLRNQVTRRAFV